MVSAALCTLSLVTEFQQSPNDENGNSSLICERLSACLAMERNASDSNGKAGDQA